MLKVAVPNKGSLAEAAAAMLHEAGYRVRRDSKDLVLTDPDNDIEFFYLRPRDIALYVGSGTIDAGITGRDLLLDSGSPAEEVLALGFGSSTFHFAARPGDIDRIDQLDGARVATSYGGLVTSYLNQRGIEATVVRLDGAVETAITLGVADAIADVVETGMTLRQQGLSVFGDALLHSEAVLIKDPSSSEKQGVEVLFRRMTGVVTARGWVMFDYDVPATLVDAACSLTPGLESPTVSKLHDRQWAAVRAMVPRPRTNAIMDQLYELGARGILVTEISACRL